MSALGRASLLSAGAHRLLRLVTPEPTPLTLVQREHPVVAELERAGLVHVEFAAVGYVIRLTSEGRQWRAEVNN